MIIKSKHKKVKLTDILVVGVVVVGVVTFIQRQSTTDVEIITSEKTENLQEESIIENTAGVEDDIQSNNRELLGVTDSQIQINEDTVVTKEGETYVVEKTDNQSTTNEAVLQTQLESRFIQLVNLERTKQGLAELSLISTMTEAARDWTLSMTLDGVLAHASDITTGLPAGWTNAGENVGFGGSVDQVMQSFINSDGHRANILDPNFNSIGVGVYQQGDLIWTTHRFAKINN